MENVLAGWWMATVELNTTQGFDADKSNLFRVFAHTYKYQMQSRLSVCLLADFDGPTSFWHTRLNPVTWVEFRFFFRSIQVEWFILTDSMEPNLVNVIELPEISSFASQNAYLDSCVSKMCWWKREFSREILTRTFIFAFSPSLENTFCATTNWIGNLERRQQVSKWKSSKPKSSPPHPKKTVCTNEGKLKLRFTNWMIFNF